METAGIFASLSSSIVEYFLVIAGFFFAYCILVVYFEICANLWSKYMNLWRRGTWICRAMFFIIPFVTVISAISYGLIMLWMKDPKLVSCIYVVIFYCSTYFTGYKSDCKTEKKFLYRQGHYAQISRCIFIAPWSPLIAVYLLLKQPCIKLWKIIKKSKPLFIKDESKTLKNPYESKPTINSNNLLYNVAIWAAERHEISTSAIQRHFSIGYTRASKIIDQLYHLGICGPVNVNSEPRIMLLGKDEINEMQRLGKFE